MPPSIALSIAAVVFAAWVYGAFCSLSVRLQNERISVLLCAVLAGVTLEMVVLREAAVCFNLGAFDPFLILVLVFAVSYSTRALPRDGLKRLRSIAGQSKAAWFRAGALFRFVVLAAMVLALLRLLRGLAMPPLGWDALTYHLFKAARWGADAGPGFMPAPNAWGYYEHFPGVGSDLWAWVLSFGHGDGLLSAAGFCVWVGIGIVGFALAEFLGASRRWAAWSALALLLNPSVFNYMTAAYVDNTALLFFLLAALFVARLREPDSRPFHWFLAAASLGLAAGTRISFLPVAALGLLFLPWLGWPTKATGCSRWKAMLLVAVGLLPGLFPYIRNMVAVGNPLYPFAFTGLKLHHSEELQSVLSAQIYGPEFSSNSFHAYWRFLYFLFLRPDFIGWRQCLNPGPAGALLLIAGIAAVLQVWRHRSSRPAILFLLFSCIILAAGILAPSNLALRTVWWPMAGRFLTPLLAVGAILCALHPNRLSRFAMVTACFISLPLGFPMGWSMADLAATQWVFACFAGSVVVALAMMTANRVARTYSWAVFAATTITALALLPMITARHRDAIYAAAAGGHFSPCFDLHPLGKTEARAFPIWTFLDRVEQPAKVAVTAGWKGAGHNMLLYPLLGSHLQHSVVWVSPLRDGSVADYRNPAAIRERGSADAWMKCLAEQRVDYVAILAPPPPELEWVETHPAQFKLVAGAPGLGSRLYQVLRPPN
ncbi:MAG: hypothetical protein K1X53_01580 [Candidatus Sumerlaeaceae bacterium]|nr:hypothetical protein [Candidatus Sumerlaeaceae bacterium]